MLYTTCTFMYQFLNAALLDLKRVILLVWLDKWNAKLHFAARSGVVSVLCLSWKSLKTFSERTGWSMYWTASNSLLNYSLYRPSLVILIQLSTSPDNCGAIKTLYLLKNFGFYLPHFILIVTKGMMKRMNAFLASDSLSVSTLIGRTHCCL